MSDIAKLIAKRDLLLELLQEARDNAEPTEMVQQLSAAALRACNIVELSMADRDRDQQKEAAAAEWQQARDIANQAYEIYVRAVNNRDNAWVRYQKLGGYIEAN